jgi:hypothetical protein
LILCMYSTAINCRRGKGFDCAWSNAIWVFSSVPDHVHWPKGRARLAY